MIAPKKMKTSLACKSLSKWLSELLLTMPLNLDDQDLAIEAVVKAFVNINDIYIDRTSKLR